MESAKERKRSAVYKSIAVALTLIFHVGLFGGLYYAMEGSTGEEIELMEDGKVKKEVKKQART